MRTPIIIPAQIRAGRALLGWTQEQLAEASKVALSSIRDIESQKRDSTPETLGAIIRALQNAGVVFVTGTAKEGPGVRLVGDRPNIIRMPTIVTAFDGLPFTVEWQGDRITVLISQEAIEDLGRLRGNEDRAKYLKVFETHRATILEGVVNAAADKNNYDRQGRLLVRGEDIPGLT